MRKRSLRLTVMVVLLALAGCSPDQPTALGDAYVAPATLNLRTDPGQKNTSTVMLKHGERLRILDVRRRFVRVRTDHNAEGWVDASQLLSTEQMDEFKKNTAHALTLPSQGEATVYEALNVHIDANRQSPSFTKVPAGGAVEVIAHKLAPKATGPAPANLMLTRQSQTLRRPKKEKAQKATSFKLPKPPAPKPPDNWKDLSAEKLHINEEPSEPSKPATPADQKAAEAKANKKPPVLDEDWSLVRTKDKQCGWVLSRNLNISIPDEVAQYGEGKRISAYFDLGAVDDKDKGVKHDWLWATSSDLQNFDFDGIRVFTWNRRRHHYETAFRARDLEGYFPIRVETPAPGSINRTFSVIDKADDGKYWLRHYQFDGTRARFTGKDPFQPGSTDTVTKAAPLAVDQMEAKAAPQPGWLKRQWGALKKRFSGE
jgi:uncharacterized protein YgiM (DUF1202 family)